MNELKKAVKSELMLEQAIDLSPQQHPQGPDGQCCEQCRFYYRFTGNVNVCRRFPPSNRQVMLKNTDLVGGRKQMVMAIDHPQTLPYTWCGYFERDTKKDS